MHAGLVEDSPIMRDVLVYLRQGPIQPLELKRRELIARGDLSRIECIAPRRQVGAIEE